jgi:hypothetical protein
MWMMDIKARGGWEKAEELASVGYLCAGVVVEG